jgi:hypothetical protein
MMAVTPEAVSSPVNRARRVIRGDWWRGINLSSGRINLPSKCLTERGELRIILGL